MCLFTGGGGYPSQFQVPDGGYHPSIWGYPHRAILPNWLYPPPPIGTWMGVPPLGMDGTWACYAAEGTPLAVSCRRTFLFLIIMFCSIGVDPCLANGRKQRFRDEGKRPSHQEIWLENCQNLRVIHIQRFSRRKERVGEKSMTSCFSQNNV